MGIADSIKLLELQTKIIYNIASEMEINEFESIKKSLNQSQISSLKWFKSESEKLRKMYMGDLIIK